MYVCVCQACEALAESLDVVRREYWLYRQSEIAQQQQEQQQAGEQGETTAYGASDSDSRTVHNSADSSAVAIDMSDSLPPAAANDT